MQLLQRGATGTGRSWNRCSARCSESPNESAGEVAVGSRSSYWNLVLRRAGLVGGDGSSRRASCDPPSGFRRCARPTPSVECDAARNYKSVDVLPQGFHTARGRPPSAPGSVQCESDESSSGMELMGSEASSTCTTTPSSRCWTARPASRAGRQGGRARDAGDRHHRPRRHVRRPGLLRGRARSAGVKPIIGVEAYVAPGRGSTASAGRTRRSTGTSRSSRGTRRATGTCCGWSPTPTSRASTTGPGSTRSSWPSTPRA